MRRKVTTSVIAACVVITAIIAGFAYLYILRSSNADELVKASRNCDIMTMNNLLKSGVSPDRPSAQWVGFSAGEPRRETVYALNAAASSGCTDGMALLVSNGASLTAVDSDGMTPLSSAARWGKPKSIEWLLENGADPKYRDSSGRTSLHWAAGYGDPDSVIMLIDEGLSAASSDIYGMTPLKLASLRVDEKGKKIVEILSTKP